MRIGVKGVGFDPVTLSEAAEKCREVLGQEGGHYVVTPNPEIVWLARKMPELKAALNSADLVIPDGIGIIYGARILGTPLKERVPGIELTEKMLAYAASADLPVFLLGAKPGVAERAGEKLQIKYPGLRVAGCGDGYFREDAPVLARLRDSGARIILVCLGFPRQELWMADHRNEVGQVLMLGVGGSMDVFAGDVKRAPEAWCKAGLEWLYRLLSQPSRIKRMIKLPIFLLSVAWERVTHGKADRI
jgi:N-acetylglucosaminyldiphosphoundecaprenol N-acetyl-beta-D-mannosaminyltransferase